MRFGSVLLLCAVGLSASAALADDAATPAYPQSAPEAKTATTHAAKPTTKPAAKTAAKPVAKPAALKPVAARPTDTKPVLPAPKPAAIAVAKPEPMKPTDTPKPVAAAATPKTGAAPDALAGIPARERLAVQSALLWSGDYTGAVAGEDPMLAAIKNFQKRAKAKVTGELTADERARLIAAAHDHEQEFGWSVVADPATGVRIGLPTKLLPQARDAPRGTHWSSPHGDVQVETFRVTTNDLAALFDHEKKQPATRQVEYSVMHPDSFFISGMQGLKIFSVKAQMRDGEVRGFTMMYDQMMEGIVAPVMVAMASAFSPFPEHNAPFAALAKPVEYGTGLIVSSMGDIVTDRKLAQGCQVVVTAGVGNADRIADDPGSGLALLRVYGARKLTPMPLALGTPKPGDVTLTGMSDPKEQDGRKSLADIKARLTDGATIELRQPVPMAGFSGAAALDADGNFVGMIEMGNAVLASSGPAPPPVRLVSAQTIRAFLEARDVAPSTQGGDVKAAIVRVICVRK
jgi:hypothetical protein